MRKFSEDHVWADVEDGEAVVGLTAYAAEELGDITFVEVPESGTVLTEGEPLCVVESSKAASDIFAPIGGTVAAVNLRLEDAPDLLNTAPEQEGWICRLAEIDKMDVENLMTEEEYEAYVAGEEAEEESPEA